MADDPLLVQARLIRSLIADQESRTARLLRDYTGAFRRMLSDWRSLLDEIEATLAEGPESRLGLLAGQRDRLERLLGQTRREVEKFAEAARRQLETEQSIAIEAAGQHAAEVTAVAAAASAPGIAVEFAQLPARALEDVVGKMANGMPLRALFDAVAPEAAATAEQALFNGLAAGINPTVVARGLQSALSLPATRAVTISRTEMLHSYRTATLASYRANSDVVKGWIWNAHLESSCPSCIVLHGTVHPLTETMHEHINGRCVASPLTVDLADLGLVDRRNVPARELLATERPGPDWFDELSVGDQLAILGPAKFALLQSGRIDLADLVYADWNPAWGVQFREASIAQALSNHQAGGTRFSYRGDGR